jgi:3-oxoacyl-[acyl-carrier-protein] synthase-3
MARNALVVGSEALSRITDMEDRGTAVLFGDGAGAAVLRPSADPERGIIAAKLGADGGRAKAVWVPGGGSAEPASIRTVNERLHYMKMRGREIYKFAVTMMHSLVQETLDDAGIALDEVALVIPHQSNLRIIESAAERLGLSMDKVAINIDRYGNTSAASIAMAFHEACETRRVQPGDLVMLVGFGAGLTWGSALMRI